MGEFLVPAPDQNRHMHNPYTDSGARSVLRRFRNDVITMLRHMQEVEEEFEDGRAMLSKSPLKKKIYVAAAMKTLGLVTEENTPNGSCVLLMTDKARKQIEDLERYL